MKFDSNVGKDNVNSIIAFHVATCCLRKDRFCLLFAYLQTLTFFTPFHRPNVSCRNFFWLFVLFHFIFRYLMYTLWLDFRWLLIQTRIGSGDIAVIGEGHGHQLIYRTTGNKPQLSYMLPRKSNVVYSRFCRVFSEIDGQTTEQQTKDEGEEIKWNGHAVSTMYSIHSYRQSSIDYVTLFSPFLSNRNKRLHT